MRWSCVIASIDRIILNMVRMMMDMRGDNMNLVLRLRMMMNVRRNGLMLIIALLVIIRWKSWRRTSVNFISWGLIWNLKTEEISRVIA